MSIGTNIKHLRISSGLTQLELGKKLGVSDKAVSTWETDKKVPRMGVIEKMSALFGVEKSDIIEDRSITAKQKASPSDGRLSLLCKNYNELNELGKAKLLEYSEDLIGNINYTNKEKNKKRA